MKKICGLCMAALLVALSGCSDASTNISDPSTKIVTIGNTTITRGDVYPILKNQGGVSSIISQVTKIICDKEVPVDDEIKKKAEESLATFKSLVGEENWESFIASTGYSSEEEYMNERIIAAAQAEKLVNKYLEQNTDAIFAEYQPRQLQIFATDNEDTAKQALEKIQGGAEVKDVVSELGGSEEFSGETILMTSAAGLASNVWSKIAEQSEPGVINEVLNTLTFSTYYVVKVVDVDPNNYKEQAVTTLAQVKDVQNEGFKFFLDKYNFEIYDIDVYNAFKLDYPYYIDEQA